ncbi:hypothetical protein L8R84_18235 [Vibrio splendidus]|uniref:hypothetical protein n=1 Tax=Vibrio TaxID=662 RepID=UPI00107F7BB3|nr:MULTISPECIES: hypothetical protein [Vibrio]MDH5938059.1 hypothetical protein [Vibrio splendidus]
MLDSIIIALTIITSIAGIIIAAWSYVDTHRIQSHQEFLIQRKIEHKEAQERFKEGTRLGKRD